MTITRAIHAKFGGCAAYRARCVDGALMHGAWAASDPSLWEETASLTLGELATKIEAMAPRVIAFRPDEPWTAGAQTSADMERAERLRVARARGAAKIADVRRKPSGSARRKTQREREREQHAERVAELTQRRRLSFAYAQAVG